MMPDELRSVVLAVLAAVIVTPLLGWVGSRVFPPEDRQRSDVKPAPHELRYQFIEWAGVGFFLAGFSVPFLLLSTNELKPNFTNIILVLAFGFLFMVGGISLFSALLGDRNAENFRKYFERKRGISHQGVRIIARILVIGSAISLIVVLFLDSQYW